GSGAKTLEFTYTVLLGNVASDLDYVTGSPLALSGGTMTYVYNGITYNAFPLFPAPGASGSLSANKNLLIDAGPTLTVPTAADSGAGSLRAIIDEAESGSKVVFAPGLAGQTITLLTQIATSGKSLSISAIAAPGLTLSGNNL